MIHQLTFHILSLLQRNQMLSAFASDFQPLLISPHKSKFPESGLILYHSARIYVKWCAMVHERNLLYLQQAYDKHFLISLEGFQRVASYLPPSQEYAPRFSTQ